MSLKAIVLMSLLMLEGVLSFSSGLGDPTSTDFTYNIHPSDPLGVYNWHLSYPDYCAGNQQSPVDIKTDFVRYNPTLQCPFIYYQTNPIWGQISNTGSTVSFKPADPNVLTITNVPYRPGQYLFNGFHIHYGGLYGRIWNTQHTPGFLHPGAEHTLDGYRYDGEVHITFRNSQYGLRDQSVFSEEDGLVVVAIFVRVLPDQHVQDLRFSRFLEENILSVSAINETETVSMDPSMFFGTSCRSYYTYQGSKTAPYCGESVRWIIFHDPIDVTQSAWYELSQVESRGNFVSLYGNYRNEQRLNLRAIETNIPPPPIDE